jgi:hypothetical protein
MPGSALLLGRIVPGGCWRADPAVRQGARLPTPAARRRAIERFAGQRVPSATL